MRHKVSGYKLNRSMDHRKSLRRNLMRQLFESERIKTTHTKAKAIRSEAEHLITIARNSSVAAAADVTAVETRAAVMRRENALRLVSARMGLGCGAGTIVKLFNDIAPRFKNRNGGYTRIIKLMPRLGDAADMVLLELVEE